MNNNFYFQKRVITFNTMFPSIIEQIINNSDHLILGLAFQNQLNDSEIVTGFSYWTIEPFENYPFNNQTISPNWPLSSFNPGFISPTTVSLSFLQNQFCGQDINFNINFTETFWSKNEPVNTYGIVPDGKTHLDSVVEAVVKAILNALESFVKAVKDLASKVFDWIWSFISNLVEKALHSIGNLVLKAMKNYVSSQIHILEDAYLNHDPPNDYDTAVAIGGVIFGIVILVLGVLFAIQYLVDGLTIGTGRALITAIGIFLVPLIIAAFGGKVTIGGSPNFNSMTALSDFLGGIATGILKAIIFYVIPRYALAYIIQEGAEAAETSLSQFFSVLILAKILGTVLKATFSIILAGIMEDLTHGYHGALTVAGTPLLIIGLKFLFYVSSFIGLLTKIPALITASKDTYEIAPICTIIIDAIFFLQLGYLFYLILQILGQVIS